jgi:hypothetical protein
VVAGNTFIWWRRQGEGSGGRGQGAEPSGQWSVASGQGRGEREGSPAIFQPASLQSPILDSSPRPWLVFCSPPYAFYVERNEDMLELLGGLLRAAPAESIFVVEADDRFDFQTLPEPTTWDVRSYPPAVVGIRRIS